MCFPIAAFKEFSETWLSWEALVYETFGNSEVETSEHYTTGPLRVREIHLVEKEKLQCKLERLS